MPTCFLLNRYLLALCVSGCFSSGITVARGQQESAEQDAEPRSTDEAKPEATAASRKHQRLAWFDSHQELLKNSKYATSTWQAVGPMQMSGRGVDVAVHPAQPQTIFFATAAGGVWKSVDDGINWNPIFENYATASIGDIAIAPSDPNLIWVGTGESNILRSSMAGVGVFKSLDGGQSFEHMGLTDTQHISRIVIHPKNPNILYVASSGNEYTSNSERGVYKTVDGGKTWTQVFFKNVSTSVTDLVLDPQHPDTLYVGTAPRLRYRWNDPVGGPETGVYKSNDGGRTWKSLTTNGLPDFSTGQYERVGIDLCAAQPETVYVLLNHDGATDKGTGAKVYRSDDAGENFRMIEGNEGVRATHPSYGWFFGQIRVDPSDAETVYVFGLSTKRTRDGGYTWENVPGNHSDYHGAWINPSDSNHIVVINDGGIMISHDGLATYRTPTNLQIAHNYNCGISQEQGKFWIYVSTQDTGAWRGLVDLSRGRNSIVSQVWERATGDESGRHAVDPSHPNLVYSVSRYGGGPQLTDYSEQKVVERRGRHFESYKTTDVAVEFEKGDLKRAQWVSPLIISPHDSQRLFYGAQYVFRTDDGGKNWQKISPDLSNFDPDKQGNVAHAVVFAIAESPVEKGVIYAGSDDGNLHVTRDNGESWTEIGKHIPDLPPGLCVAGLEACHFDAGTIYAAFNGIRYDQFECRLYRSTDYGATWESITANIPGSNANVIKQDPANKDLLFAGTDRAVYVSVDGAKSWDVLGKGLPTAYVHDLAIQTAEDYAVISTHGRGCFVLDIRNLRKPSAPSSTVETPAEESDKKDDSEKPLANELTGQIGQQPRSAEALSASAGMR